MGFISRLQIWAFSDDKFGHLLAADLVIFGHDQWTDFGHGRGHFSAQDLTIFRRTILVSEKCGGRISATDFWPENGAK